MGDTHSPGSASVIAAAKIGEERAVAEAVETGRTLERLPVWRDAGVARSVSPQALGPSEHWKRSQGCADRRVVADAALCTNRSISR